MGLQPIDNYKNSIVPRHSAFIIAFLEYKLYRSVWFHDPINDFRVIAFNFTLFGH